VVVFTQARISDHNLYNKCFGRNDINYLLRIKNEALLYSKSIDCNTQINHGKWNFKNGDYYLKNNYKNNTPTVFIDWFKQNINNTYPEPLLNYSFGIFAVSKELVLNHPIEYYKKLLLEVNHHINPTEGHFFERSWYYIFN
jgi:hypothetical protein